MSVTGDFPVAQMPLLPIRGNATQTQISGANGFDVSRTITTPQDDLPITCDGVTVYINPSMMGPQDVMLAFRSAGLLGVTLDRNGCLVFPETPTGNATLLTALGF